MFSKRVEFDLPIIIRPAVKPLNLVDSIAEMLDKPSRPAEVNADKAANKYNTPGTQKDTNGKDVDCTAKHLERAMKKSGDIQVFTSVAKGGSTPIEVVAQTDTSGLTRFAGEPSYNYANRGSERPYNQNDKNPHRRGNGQHFLQDDTRDTQPHYQRTSNNFTQSSTYLSHSGSRSIESLRIIGHNRPASNRIDGHGAIVKPKRDGMQEIHRQRTIPQLPRQSLPLTQHELFLEKLARENRPEIERERILRAQFDTDNNFRKWNRKQVFEGTGLEVENADARRARRRKYGLSRTRL